MKIRIRQFPLAAGAARLASAARTKKRLWEAAALAALLLLSSLFHFRSIANPQMPVFDEVLFATYASHYASRTPFYDIHPPLGKMLFGAIARTAGVRETVFLSRLERGEDGNVNVVIDDSSWRGFPYLPLRRVSAAVGVAVIMLFYALARLLGLGAATSLLAAALLSFDNALLLETRLILIDGLLMFFGLSGLVLLCVKDRVGSGWRRRGLTLLAALVLGFAASVKFTGFGYALAALLAATFSKLGRPITIAPMTSRSFLAAIVAVVLVSFAVHELVVPPQEQLAYFRTILSRRPAALGQTAMASVASDESPAGVYAIGYLTSLFLALEGNFSGYDNAQASPWYLWPFGFRPIHYWTASEGGSSMVLAGNTILWLSGFAAVILLAIRLLRRRDLSPPLGFLLIAYAANTIPFAVFLLTGRPTFLYHYLTAMMFSVVALAALLNSWMVRSFGRRIVGALVGLAVAANFVVVLPLTYGETGLIQHIFSRLFDSV